MKKSKPKLIPMPRVRVECVVKNCQNGYVVTVDGHPIIPRDWEDTCQFIAKLLRLALRAKGEK